MRLLRGILALYPLALVAILWQIAASLGWVRPIFLPSLTKIVEITPKLLTDGEVISPLFVSLYRAAAGLILAMAIGIPLGFLIARIRWIRWLFDPFVAVGSPSPKIAFLPVFVLWFGIGHLSKILLVTFTTVFPFIIAAYAGAMTVPVNQLWAARAMGTSNLGLLRRVILPASLPALMNGFRVAVPYALMTAFTAEMIAGGGGLGGALVLAQRYFDTPTVFVYILIMLIVGYIGDNAVTWLRRRILRWHEE